MIRESLKNILLFNSIIFDNFYIFYLCCYGTIDVISYSLFGFVYIYYVIHKVPDLL